MGLTRLLRFGSRLNRLFVELRGSLVILCLIGLVGGLVRLTRLQFADLAASDPRASIATTASDAPVKERIEPPQERK